MLSWMHPYNRAVIVRSSQPMVGVTRAQNQEDQLLLRAILLSCLDQELGDSLILSIQNLVVDTMH